MAKSKTQTPQELYRARKQREDQEKTALLPPGLLNHGNTCFMNSVLQGLIATRLLSDLALFRPISPSIHYQYNISSRKSPLLTNGHKLGGQYEESWVDSMPIGDVFLDLMVKAWDSQAQQKRENLSPKAILAALGRKYDQYLDFAQQDAHEFLRILLDASRMEELDAIKKRQPPPEKVKKRRRTTITPARMTPQSSSLPPSIPEEEKLATLSDMVFGGKFASILVCRECKHVSTTYEDFNDISLSIKAEDYHARKRDRLKNFAKRLTSSLGATNEVPRPSSVPPSPREGERQLAGHEEPVLVAEPRRRSFDVVPDPNGDQDSDTSASTSKDEYTAPREPTMETLNESKGKHVEILPSAKSEKSDKKDKSDTWVKFGRRISLGIRKSRSRERSNKELHQVLEAPPMESAESGASASSNASEAVPTVDVVSPSPTLANGEDGFLIIQRASSRPATPPTQSHAHLLPLNAPQPTRSKSPKPPKPTTVELNYLREILADVMPSSSNNPFTFLQTQGNRSVSATGASSNLWLSMNHFSRIEECLRIFTSVEILDGENMVGCRRCWKIAHGEFEKASVEDEDNGDEDSDDAEQDSVDVDPLPEVISNGRSTLLTDLTPPEALPHIPISMSTPTVSLYTHPNSSSSNIIPSPPTTAPSSIHESDVNALPPSVTCQPRHPSTPTPDGLFAISTTDPDSHIRPSLPQVTPSSQPVDIPNDKTPTIAQPLPRLGQVLNHLPAPKDESNSFLIPSPSPGPDLEGDESSGAESDASVATSTRSTASSTSVNDVPRPATPVRKKPKPVLMRPAYKRYLIAMPPPVLVIHFKRFQQVNKTHMLSFSHGFKKLDDFVAFPEFLDVAPYLAPRKEDFGLGQEKSHSGIGLGLGVGKPPHKGEKCMYRLYAVVVHIGNMLGGHYIAYTALPEGKPTTTDTSEKPPVSESSTETEVKVPRQWAYISDTIVRLTTLEEVLKAKAYICMYERIEA